MSRAAPARWLRRARRCYLECGDRPWIDLAALLRGELLPGSAAMVRAYLPPDAKPIDIDADEARVIALCPQHEWVETKTLQAPHAAVARLLELGVLRGSDEARPEREDGVGSDAHAEWFGPATLYHYASRWHGVEARPDLPGDAIAAQTAYSQSAEAFAADAQARGPVPTHRHSRGDDARAIELPNPPASGFDALLKQRETHRLFDPARPLALAALASLLHRSFATQAEAPMGGGLTAQRKNAPSGGGLHPVEAYVLASNVDGLEAGWYHYRSHQHRLAPMEPMAKAEAGPRIVARTAGQAYFRDAAALVALTLRFPRHHWKYPRHAKAYRVMLLDAGHVGQLFALAATEAGLGAFLTAAINEADIDADLGLDGIEEGVVAVLGCGHPASDGGVLRLSSYVVTG
ncbi:MAG: putative peptide maturation dehydrogenase [Chiayiivirga sp.]|uniref:putative peptide maturation dehydrogenase n=1 Tax=Chiayiivirga sp. TaxID=2041042 RepID=UPI0025C41058|nr:putative peptide maturation dehydrogenase [Chiayiivirga sp.]MCI1711689.1 putative peptide maturation dehydrogenase [Chiayiivirga sp.]MCI1729732.1 putative peptide maturation dehydrogenase [Chiayiivirga sp.]